MLMVLDTSFSIYSDAIVAKLEELSPKAWRERWAGAGRAFGVWLRAFLQDCLERVIQRVRSDLHHVYHWRRLIGLKEVDLIEVVDAATLSVVGEKMVHGVLIDWTHTHQHKRIGLQHALRRGGEWSELNSMPFRSCRDHQIRIWPP